MYNKLVPTMLHLKRPQILPHIQQRYARHIKIVARKKVCLPFQERGPSQRGAIF